jgi:hypothetical protein
MAKRRIPVVSPEIDPDDLAEALVARRTPRNDWSRTWQAISVILSVAAIVFTAGVGWSKTTALEARVGNLENSLQQITAKQSDQSKDTAVLIQKVDQLSNIVAEIKGQLQRPSQSGQR